MHRPRIAEPEPLLTLHFCMFLRGASRTGVATEHYLPIGHTTKYCVTHSKARGTIAGVLTALGPTLLAGALLAQTAVRLLVEWREQLLASVARQSAGPGVEPLVPSPADCAGGRSSDTNDRCCNRGCRDVHSGSDKAHGCGGQYGSAARATAEDVVLHAEPPLPLLLLLLPLPCRCSVAEVEGGATLIEGGGTATLLSRPMLARAGRARRVPSSVV